MTNGITVGFLMWLAAAVGPALAGQATLNSDGQVNWQEGADGVQIGWNADGSVKNITSKNSQPVEFPDRRGIHTAQVIAEEKAKADVIRFMKQSVATSRVVTDVENDLNKATQERLTSAKASVGKVDERTLIRNLTEVTASFAAGNLTGVVVLETGYDSKTEEAWTVVGISNDTLSAARKVQQMLSGPAANPPPAVEQNGTQNSDLTQPSEVRRSNQKGF